MPRFTYEFEWDPSKERANLAKHGIDFQSAAAVFRDPLALTISDDQHSEEELRWITMEKDLSDRYVLVVHTFEETAGRARVRLISARKPTSKLSRRFC